MVVCISKIHVVKQDFYTLSNHIFHNWKKCLFPISVGTFVAEANSLIKLMHPISQNYPWENGVKKIKATEEKLSQGRTLCPNAKNKDPNRRIKMHQLFFLIFTTICLIPAEWMCFFLRCLAFLESLWWPVWTFYAQKKNKKGEHMKIFCGSTKIFKNIS